MKLRRTLPVAVVLAAMTWATPALAQAARPERPYRGLFGGDNNASFDQQLTANASVGGGWDSNLLADALGRNTPRVSNLNSTHRGGVGTGSASLAYSLSRDRVSANASGGTSARYYPSFDSNFIRREYASGGLTVNIGKGLSAGALATYRPYSLASMFPVLLGANASEAAIDEDFASSNEHFVAYSGNVGFSHNFSLRTSMNLDANYRARESSARSTRFTSYSAGGGLSHSLTRDLSLRLGYHYREARYSGIGQRPVNHVIDAGVDYHHALSISRRTTVSFSTGTSAVSRGFGDRTRYRAVGSAELTHEMGRTWSTSLAYNRGMNFMDSWPEPVFTDALTLGLGGLLTQRVQFHAGASAVNGSRAFNANRGDKLRGYYGSAGVSYAFTRFMNTGVTYSYYSHRFADSLVLAPGLPHQVDRESVRVYVSFWAPVFQRSRRQ